MGWGGQPHAQAASTRGKHPVPIVQEAECAPGPVWTGGNLAPTGIRSRTVQPVAQSLYRLSYRTHALLINAPLFPKGKEYALELTETSIICVAQLILKKLTDFHENWY